MGCGVSSSFARFFFNAARVAHRFRGGDRVCLSIMYVCTESSMLTMLSMLSMLPDVGTLLLLIVCAHYDIFFISFRLALCDFCAGCVSTVSRRGTPGLFRSALIKTFINRLCVCACSRQVTTKLAHKDVMFGCKLLGQMKREFLII